MEKCSVSAIHTNCAVAQSLCVAEHVLCNALPGLSLSMHISQQQFLVGHKITYTKKPLPQHKRQSFCQYIREVFRRMESIKLKLILTVNCNDRQFLGDESKVDFILQQPRFE